MLSESEINARVERLLHLRDQHTNTVEQRDLLIRDQERTEQRLLREAGQRSELRATA